MRAAIYARFSTDLQNERSVEDQIALCRAYADRFGWRIAETFADRAASGASIHGRPDYQRLMGMAHARQFDAILTEDIDRLSRNLADIARLFETMNFAGVKLITVADGEVSEMHVGIKGTMSALFLKGLAQKVRRGMSGVIRDGRHAGGRAYGYRPIPGRPGVMEIVPEEAAIIRRIFADYVAGKSPRTIAGELNAEGILPPRGSYWAAVTITGNRKRGHGILLNQLYAGRLVWNRVRMIKDPATGRRISRVNDAEEWQSTEVPELAIVNTELFAQVNERRSSRNSLAPRERATPRHLLSGLLRCGSCGAGMSVKDRQCGRIRIRCTKANESRSCDNARTYMLDEVEDRVVSGLRDRIADREAIEIFVRAYNDERKRLVADSINRRARVERQLAMAEREYERVYRSYVKGFIEEDELDRELPPLKAERERLRRELAACDEPPCIISLHPATVKRYLGSIDTLAKTIAGGDLYGAGSKAALRDLVKTVIVYKADKGQQPDIEVIGKLTALISGNHFPSVPLQGGRVVAGGRYKRGPHSGTKFVHWRNRQHPALPWGGSRLAA